MSLNSLPDTWLYPLALNGLVIIPLNSLPDTWGLIALAYATQDFKLLSQFLAGYLVTKIDMVVNLVIVSQFLAGYLALPAGSERPGYNTSQFLAGYLGPYSTSLRYAGLQAALSIPCRILGDKNRHGSKFGYCLSIPCRILGA